MTTLPPLPISQKWRRDFDSEVVNLDMDNRSGHFVIDVQASARVWSEIQLQLTSNPDARTENTVNQRGVGPSTTIQTIRPHTSTTSRVTVQHAAEEAMKALGFVFQDLMDV